MLTNKGLEDWYVQTVKLKHGFAGTTPPDPIPLPAVTTIDGLLEGLAEETENTLLAAADYAGKHHTEDLVYKLQLPNKIFRWNGIKAVGGKTVVMNQSVVNGNFTSTTGWTANNSATVSVSNNVITCVCPGAKSTEGFRSISSGGTAPIVGHQYYVRAYGKIVDDGLEVVMRFPAVQGNAAFGANIVTLDNTWKRVSMIAKNETNPTFSTAVGAYTNQATACTVQCKNLIVVDLTLMFGAGNEPETVEEVDAMFPEEYYAYNTGTLVTAEVTEVISKDSNGNVLDTISIPAGVQALTGYGLSSPGKYNYIDFETKKFVQNVASRAYAAGDESDVTVLTDGTTTNYDLTTPVETSVSVTTDIEYEAGGSITFENTNKIPVHVNVDYIGV